MGYRASSSQYNLQHRICLVREHSLRYAEIRKLQLAAASTDTLLFLFRSSDALSDSTPVSLRLHINAYREVTVVKQRGGKREVDAVTHEPYSGSP